MATTGLHSTAKSAEAKLPLLNFRLTALLQAPIKTWLFRFPLPYRFFSFFKIPISTPHIHNMASRSFSKALRSPMARQLAAPAQKRTFIAAAGAIRAAAPRTAAAVPKQQTRGVKTMDFAGHKEEVWGELSPTDG
jgi:hypothetical protein